MTNINNTKTNLIILIFILIYSIISLFLSIFLTIEYYQPDPIGCPLSAANENSCEIVRQSPYSVILGIKVPLWGTFYFSIFLAFTLITIIIYLKKNSYFKKSSLILFLLAFTGLIFETYMTYLQYFKIKALCKWCLFIEVFVFSIFLLSFINFLYVKFKRSK